MKKAFRVLARIILWLGGLLLFAFLFFQLYYFILNTKAKRQLAEVEVIEADGFRFRDLNKSGELDVYEDVTDVTGGTIFVPRNRNRTSDRVSQVGVIINPTTVTATNPLYEEQVIGGTGGNASGATVSVNYAVIKSDTSYLFRLINRSGKARVAELYLQWSE